MMLQHATAAIRTLGDAVRAAFPDRADIGGVDPAASGAQAWATYARLLAIDEGELARRLASVFGVDAAGSLDAIPETVLSQVPFNLCQQHNIVPLRVEPGALVIATSDPTDASLAERIGFMANKPVRWALAPPSRIEDTVLFAMSRAAERLAGSDGGGQQAIDENAVVRLAHGLMGKAIEQRASDLHVQPYMGAAVVRVRVDGSLRRLTMLPEAVATMLIRHVKARSGMDPTNNLVPQDGRQSIVVDGRDFDLRVSTLPATRGERLVIRFLHQGRSYRLGNAGFSLAALQTLRRAVARPSGMIVFTGPTGCGKTSTLYGMLAEVNRSDVNIITVENPVEYRVAGISQVEVNEKAGRGFATALRSILRQDPDVILIGEIRDRETAQIAAQSAMTGHLVLTTLHTNDAMTAIPRLLDLGVEASVLSDSLAVIAAQRLCRTLCAACKVPVTDPLTPEESAFLKLTRNRPACRAAGCATCEFTGFKGRLPIVDIVENNKTLRDAIAAGENRLAVLDGLREGGLRSLAASGSLRVISGDTTVRDVMEAVGPGFWHDLAGYYGTEYAADTADSIPMNIAQGQAVLLVGSDTALAARLEDALAEEGLRLLTAGDAASVDALLKQDEEIGFIIGDLPEGTDLPTALAILRDARVHVAWARLPAAVLLPASLAGQEEALRQSGTLAAFQAKPVDARELVAQVRRAHAR